MAPTIHLIRHAQGFHNISPAHELMRDPLLTELGRQQCLNLKGSFPYHDKLTHFYASPLRRTLYTCALSFGFDEETLNARKIIAIPELQEVSDAPCDTGSEPSLLRQEFGDLVDLTLVREGWNVKSDAMTWVAKVAKLETRALQARLKLRELLKDLNSDAHVAVVTHGAFLHFLTGDYQGVQPSRATGWENAEFRTFEFADPTNRDPDAALRETDESWARRYGSIVRPATDAQSEMKMMYCQHLMPLLNYKV